VAEDRAAARTAAGSSGVARRRRRRGRAAHGRAVSGSGGARRGRAARGGVGCGSGGVGRGLRGRRRHEAAARSGSTSPAFVSSYASFSVSMQMTCRGRWLQPGEKKGYLYPRPFSPGWWHQPGLMVFFWRLF
jgi:hypothetical protein